MKKPVTFKVLKIISQVSKIQRWKNFFNEHFDSQNQQFLFHFDFQHVILKLYYLALKWDTLEHILIVTFDFIDNNVRFTHLAHSGAVAKNTLNVCNYNFFLKRWQNVPKNQGKILLKNLTNIKKISWKIIEEIWNFSI